MLDAMIKLLVGDLEDKKEYKVLRKRVKALPEDYRFAFRKTEQYSNTVGPVDGNMAVLTDLTFYRSLVDLFEASAAEGKQVVEVIGYDVCKFADELLRALAEGTQPVQEKLNREIAEKFNLEGKLDVGLH